ncbi:HK97 family phage prohead protease [Clostridium botulinum]|uniref:HK97 family phage prohead protease n=1 Tax=Clostridium botulinum TaxID=1491 RepID=UPI001C9AD883|nr:HK97 family phage prohead protease [Clostridium botulinum]MBY6809029.1 HK97 family phage prohead protease [Clostridium botulinum]MBY6822266.1 HK97 family phage prohead protease [Clostridium botulinum]MBY6832944.1 HK97 family phage prohead protease [Clostridium botulinum]MBY6972172.1 HK97 family phage prohead protease [Clostridium botulinum]HBJ1649407.1 HK97 family phage prohead protease [Clostridium botulinum]
MEIRLLDDRVELQGYINVTERKSKIMKKPSGENFVEIIKQGTFKRALERNNNVLMLLDHDLNKKIGKCGENVELKEDNIGLHYRATLTDEETVQLAKDNNLVGCSFGFNNPSEINKKIGILEQREIKDLDLFEVSILSKKKNPAYSGCSVEIRDLENKNIDLEIRELEDYNTDNTKIDMSSVYNADLFILKNKNNNL